MDSFDIKIIQYRLEKTRDFGKSQEIWQKNVIPQEILKIFVISQEVDAKNSKKHPGNVTFVEMPPGY